MLHVEQLMCIEQVLKREGISHDLLVRPETRDDWPEQEGVYSPELSVGWALAAD